MSETVSSAPAATLALYLLSNDLADLESNAVVAASASSDERVDAARLQLERDRLEHLAARGLTRIVLGAALGVEPGALRFARGAHGRPRLVEPERPIDFNLSHTSGLIALLVGEKAALFGVDVEDTRRRRGLHLAEDFFAPSEVRAVQLAPPAEAGSVFLRLWTLKEAYIKARGLGLAIPLDSFAFALGPPVFVSFTPCCPALPNGAADAPSEWSFATLTRGPHQIAIAVRSPRLPVVRIVVVRGGHAIGDRLEQLSIQHLDGASSDA